MAEKTKQHYVPKCYMKRFSTNGRIDVLKIDDFSVVPNVSFADQCHSNYYYGKDLIWENRLSVLESQWDSVLDKIESNNIYCLTDAEERSLRLFALYQRNRTVGFNNHESKQRQDLLVEQLLMTGQINRTDAKQFVITKKDDWSTSPSNALDITQKYETSLDDLAILIVEYDCLENLIVSDDPVVFVNKYNGTATGYLNIGLLIFFPISRKKLAVLYDAKVYTKWANKQYIKIANSSELEKANKFQLINANKIVLLTGQTNIDKQRSSIEHLRVENLRLNQVYSMGAPHSDGIPTPIIQNAKRTVSDTALFFMRIDNKLVRIPEIFRFNLPRRYNQESAKKLQMAAFAYDVFETKADRKKKSDGISVYDYNKKQRNKFRQELLKFAKAYWGNIS